MRWMVLVFLLAVPAMCYAVNGSDQPNLAKDAENPGKKVVQRSCGRCHDTMRICSNLGKDEAWWKKTNLRMIRNGAPIRPGQAEDAAMYLSSLQPGDAEVCSK